MLGQELLPRIRLELAVLPIVGPRPFGLDQLGCLRSIQLAGQPVQASLQTAPVGQREKEVDQWETT